VYPGESRLHTPLRNSYMSIWLACSVTSSHKSSPLVRVDYISMDVLRKTATLTSMKRNISTDCVAIFITTGYRCRCDLGSTNKPHSHVDPILECPCVKEWWEGQLVGSILADHLGLLFCSGRQGICGSDRSAFWNWRTEDLLAVRSRFDIYMPGF